MAILPARITPFALRQKAVDLVMKIPLVAPAAVATEKAVSKSIEKFSQWAYGATNTGGHSESTEPRSEYRDAGSRSVMQTKRSL